LEVDASAQKFTVMDNGFARYDSPKLELKPGQTLADQVIRLIPTGTISGRVVNTSGKTVSGVTIAILRGTTTASGQPGGLSTVTTVQTNDLGEYRAYWVTPGSYYVSAGGSTSGSRNPNDIAEDYPQIFFPGVTEVAKAILIDLKEGADRRDIDFSVPR